MSRLASLFSQIMPIAPCYIFAPMEVEKLPCEWQYYSFVSNKKKLCKTDGKANNGCQKPQKQSVSIFFKFVHASSFCIICIILLSSFNILSVYLLFFVTLNLKYFICALWISINFATLILFCSFGKMAPLRFGFTHGLLKKVIWPD